jgi:hypothetical protein
MIIRLEDSFIKLVQQLGKPFSEADKHRLAELVSSSITYEKLRSVISDQERDKERSKPTVIELGSIDERYFALNAYYDEDQMIDNIPSSIRELLPTISPVQIDIMANMPKADSDNDTRQNYIKVARIYDDGDIHSHYVNEVINEDNGIVPIDDT